MADEAEQFDKIMEDDNQNKETELNFEDDMFQYNIETEGNVGQFEREEPEFLTKDQQDYVEYCRELLTLSTPTTEPVIFQKLKKKNEEIMKKYSSYAIIFVFDVLKKASGIKITEMPGNGHSKCFISNEIYPLNQMRQILPTLRSKSKPVKSIPIYKDFAPLCNSLFFVANFQFCILKKIQDNVLDNSAFIADFEALDRALGFIDANLFSKT
jgi:hypothetical protein